MSTEDAEDLRLTGDLASFEHEMAPRIANALARIQGTTLLVIILGPGKESPGYDKRVQIQTEASRLPGIRALMPEDSLAFELIERKFGFDPSEDYSRSEAVLCEMADLVLALDTPSANGVNQEVGLFAVQAHISPKIVDLLPQGATTAAFGSNLRRQLHKEYFTDDDFHTCRLATSICPRIIRAKQVDKRLGRL